MTFGALAAVAIFAGCANVEPHETTLVYPHPSTQTRASSDKQIVLEAFLDHRADKTNIGTVDSVFGLRSTTVVPANDVRDWVMDAVTTELQNSGYTVTPRESTARNPGGVAAAVSGVIVDVSCNAGDSAKVELVGKIKRGGSEVLNKKYAANGSARSILGSSPEACAQSLAVALAASVKRFVADVDGMLGG